MRRSWGGGAGRSIRTAMDQNAGCGLGRSDELDSGSFECALNSFQVSRARLRNFVRILVSNDCPSRNPGTIGQFLNRPTYRVASCAEQLSSCNGLHSGVFYDTNAYYTGSC